MFSVAVPNYNDGKFVYDCLESLRTQEYEDIEVIFVDNCSEDNSVEEAQKFADKDPRFKVLITPEHYVSAALGINLAMEHATGELATWVNSDDYVLPDYVSSVIPYFNNPDIGFVRVGIYHYPENNPTTIDVTLPLEMGHPLECVRSNLVFCSSPYRRKWFLDVGGMDGDIRFWDWDFWVRMCIAVYERKFMYDTHNEAFVIRKIHGPHTTKDEERHKDAHGELQIKKYVNKIIGLGGFRYLVGVGDMI